MADRIVLDMDASESPVHGQQEGSAYDGHFETVCCHPLFLSNDHGDCLAATLRDVGEMFPEPGEPVRSASTHTELTPLGRWKNVRRRNLAVRRTGRCMIVLIRAATMETPVNTDHRRQMAQRG